MDLREQSTNTNRHPWELSRADMVLGLLSDRGRDTRYADIGSGDQYFARRLAATTSAPVFAVDVHYAQRGADGQIVSCTDLDQVPTGSIDCAVLMDVIEHVGDDVGLVRSVRRILAPGAEVLITVPAHAALWSDHDVFLGHHRRYNRSQLCAALSAGGLTVSECFYFYAVPFFARTAGVALTRLGRRRESAGEVSRWRFDERHPATRGVRAILNADFRISRWLSAVPLFGCGLSLCARCRPTSA